MAPGGHGPLRTMSVVAGTADLFRSEADVAFDPNVWSGRGVQEALVDAG
jgi:hypothetical protein